MTADPKKAARAALHVARHKNSPNRGNTAKHTPHNPAVAELKHLLTMHRDELRSMKGRTQYAAIDGIMKRISREHGIAPSKLHDDWISVYHQTPDAWVAGDHGNVVDRALKMTNRGGYAFGGSPAALAPATGAPINFAPAAGAFTGLPLPGTLNLAPSKATLAAILASRPTTYTGSSKPLESKYIGPSIPAPTFNASSYNLPDNPLEEGQGGSGDRWHPNGGGAPTGGTAEMAAAAAAAAGPLGGGYGDSDAAARGGRIHRADGGRNYKNLSSLESINTTNPTESFNEQPTSTPSAKPWESWQPTQYKTYNDLPVINPQDLVGKRVGSLLADLTRAGGHYSGIDSSRLDNPEVMMGGPSYGVLPESQLHKLAWAVQGKGAGTAKLNKNSDYIAIHAMNQDSHLSNASMANSVLKTIQAYLRDNRIPQENLQSLNNLIRNGAKSKEGKGLENFPGLEHPDVPEAIKKMTFEARKKMFQILDTVPAQNLGAPNINKIARATLGQEGAGVPYGHAMMLIEVPKGASQALVRLGGESGLPVHPSYDWGIHGRVVGRFAHPVAPEVLHQTWFDEKNEENKTKVTKTGRPPNLRRSFELALPVTTVTQNIADRLPHTPHDIQSSKSAQLALNAFNDLWSDTETPVTGGGVGAAEFSRALRNSDSSSTLTQYSEKNINDMKKTGKFTGYKLKNGEIYFGLKRGTNYAEDYGFEHPELTPNETSLVSVVNNEPGAKGIGGAPVVLKAIQHGATALDAYAVPTDKHPNGFLPDFYSHFGFQELGRVPFDPKFVTEHQLADMKHEWRKTGWDESRHGMPSMSIMKWKGSDENRPDAVRRFIAQGGEGFGIGDNSTNVRSASQPARPGTGPLVGTPSGQHGFSNASGDRGAIRADNAPRPADRFTRTLSAVKNLTPSEISSLGLDPNEIALAKARGLATGGNVVNRALSVVRQHAPVVPGAVSLAKHLSPGRR